MVSRITTYLPNKETELGIYQARYRMTVSPDQETKLDWEIYQSPRIE